MATFPPSPKPAPAEPTASVYLTLLSPDTLHQLAALQTQVNRMARLIRSHHPTGHKQDQALRWQRLQLLEQHKFSVLWQQCKGNLKALNLLSQHVAKLAQ